MKNLIVFLLIAVLSLSMIAADKPYPPKIVSIEVVNKAGEEIRVSFTGLGYNFNTREFGEDWGLGMRPQYYSTVIPGTIETVLPSKRVLVIKLPQVTKRVDVLKDLYVLNVTYNQEIVPSGSKAGGVICLNNWAPISMYDNPTYYAARWAHNKLIIRSCNSVPVNLGAPGEGILKYNRLMILLATSGYSY